MKKITFRILSFVFLTMFAIPAFSSDVEVLEGPFKVTRTYAFENSQSKDNFVLVWKKVKDYSVDGEGHKSKEKSIWYQVQIKIYSQINSLIFQDWFSVKQNDFNELLARSEHSDVSPKDYFEKYFFDEPQTDSITVSDLSEDYLVESMKDMKKSMPLDVIKNELLEGKHAIFYYRATWFEDLRVYAYSKKIGIAVRLLNDYEKN